jgi:enoyl-CoA hydratase
MNERRIHTEQAHGVGMITLNRPERHNALDDEGIEELAHAFDEAFADPNVRALLIRGNGKSFCSGRDVAVLGHRQADESDFHFVRRSQSLRLKLLDSLKPVVAAVHGHALGGGAELALAADIRVAATDLKLGLPEIHYGLLPDTGGSQYLAALVGPSRAKYLVLTGEAIDAETALAWGAVDFVVAPELLEQRAMAVARRLAEQPPIALAMGKHLVDQMYAGHLRNGMLQELLAITGLFRSDDYEEARAARKEKRQPNYRGR